MTMLQYILNQMKPQKMICKSFKNLNRDAKRGESKMDIKDVKPYQIKSNLVPSNSEMIKSHDVLPTPIASGIEIAPGWGNIEIQYEG